MRKLILSAILIALTYAANCQLKIKYETGFYFDTSGVKHEGLIKDDPLEKMATKFIFKDNESAKPVEITTRQARSFVVDGDEYQRISFELVKKNDGHTTHDTLFARLLIRSKLSLYESHDKKDGIFILEKDDNFFALKNDYIDGDEMISFNYKQWLHVATAPCVTVQQAERTNFNRKEFQKMVSIYNKCQNATETSVSKKSSIPVSFLMPQVMGMIYGKDYQFKAGIGYRKYFPKISDLTSLNLGLNYYVIHDEYKENFYISSSPLWNEKDYTIVSIPVTIQQNFLRGNFRPYVFAGFALSYIASLTLNDEDYYRPSGFQKDYGISLSIGAGIEWNPIKNLIFKAEYRYEVIPQYVIAGIAYNFQLSKKSK